jgi:hypothetical protein
MLLLGNRFNMQRQDFWSRFHRVFGFGYDPYGISFNYKGDEIIWLKLSKRTRKDLKFLSISFCVSYPSLKAIDEEWNRYFESMKELT